MVGVEGTVCGTVAGVVGVVAVVVAVVVVAVVVVGVGQGVVVEDVVCVVVGVVDDVVVVLPRPPPVIDDVCVACVAVCARISSEWACGGGYSTSKVCPTPLSLSPAGSVFLCGSLSRSVGRCHSFSRSPSRSPPTVPLLLALMRPPPSSFPPSQPHIAFSLALSLAARNLALPVAGSLARWRVGTSKYAVNPACRFLPLIALCS